MDFERLLEKKWGDLKHLETERHWFLGAFAVVVAGSLSFLASVNKGTDSGISALLIYIVLSILSIIGLLHALRISWMLGKLQNDINNVVSKWQEGTDPDSKQVMEFWSFVRHEQSRTRLELLHYLVYVGSLLLWVILIVWALRPILL